MIDFQPDPKSVQDNGSPSAESDMELDEDDGEECEEASDASDEMVDAVKAFLAKKPNAYDIGTHLYGLQPVNAGYQEVQSYLAQMFPVDGSPTEGSTAGEIGVGRDVDMDQGNSA